MGRSLLQLVLLLSFCKTKGEPLHLELKRHPVVLYSQGNSDKSISLRETTLSGQFQYSCNVSIGYPPQLFYLVIDTGSSDLWVQGTDCQECSQSSHERFNVSVSSTYKNDCQVRRHPCFFQVKYGSGVIDGTIGQDIVSIGSFRVKDHVQFGVTRHEFGEMAVVLQASGILGLGLGGLSEFTIPSISSYMNNFALELRPTGGLLTINGLAPKYQSDTLQWASLPCEKYNGAYEYWAVGLPEVQFGDSYICGKGQHRCQAVIDTGTGFIAVPQEHWTKMKKVFEDAGCIGVLSNNGLQQCPVDNLPSFRFTVGTYAGYDFELDMKDFTIPTDDPAIVVVGIIPSPLHVDVWILGSIFLKNYYVQFDVSNRQIWITQHGMTFTSHAISRDEQPSYMDIMYDTNAIEKLFMMMILVMSAYGIFLIVFQDNMTVPKASGDDTLLIKLLEDDQNKSSERRKQGRWYRIT